ncbi:MAG: hypothetical protein KC550_05890, partial [Nanoarchaeota archaeon]|nr:hypothetical protein [Nanoarchaeota archaeon]
KKVYFVTTENITILGTAKSKREININGNLVTWYSDNKFSINLPLKIGYNNFTAKYKVDGKDKTFIIKVKRFTNQKEFEEYKKEFEERKKEDLKKFEERNKEERFNQKLRSMTFSEKAVFKHIIKKNKNLKYKLESCKDVKIIPNCIKAKRSDKYLVECNYKHFIHEPIGGGSYIIELEDYEESDYIYYDKCR